MKKFKHLINSIFNHKETNGCIKNSFLSEKTRLETIWYNWNKFDLHEFNGTYYYCEPHTYNIKAVLTPEFRMILTGDFGEN